MLSVECRMRNAEWEKNGIKRGERREHSKARFQSSAAPNCALLSEAHIYGVRMAARLRTN